MNFVFVGNSLVGVATPRLEEIMGRYSQGDHVIVSLYFRLRAWLCEKDPVLMNAVTPQVATFRRIVGGYQLDGREEAVKFLLVEDEEPLVAPVCIVPYRTAVRCAPHVEILDEAARAARERLIAPIRSRSRDYPPSTG